MHTLVINKRNGIYGVPVNFLKPFWDTLGHDFLDVVLFSLQKGEFPISCRHAFLSLLPRRGNNGYNQNWRQISLLCSAIEKGRIRDNVHMMRDIIF